MRGGSRTHTRMAPSPIHGKGHTLLVSRGGKPGVRKAAVRRVVCIPDERSPRMPHAATGGFICWRNLGILSSIHPKASRRIGSASPACGDSDPLGPFPSGFPVGSPRSFLGHRLRPATSQPSRSGRTPSRAARWRRPASEPMATVPEGSAHHLNLSLMRRGGASMPSRSLRAQSEPGAESPRGSERNDANGPFRPGSR